MKHENTYQLRRVSLALLFPVLLTACSDDVRDFIVEPTEELSPLEFQATIHQKNTTRADESGFADGDCFGVFVVNRRNGEPGVLSLSDNQVNNVAVSFEAEANVWTPATPIYWLDNVTPADVYGYYPFRNSLADTKTYGFEVSADQSVCGGNGEMGSYEASDFLWAKASNVSPGNKVNLTFHHRLAGVKVVLEQGSGFAADEWKSLLRIITVDNTVRTSTIDLSTGIATVTGDFDRNIVAVAEEDTYRAIVIPQTVAAGKPTIGITIDGVTYNYTRDGGMTYTAGKLHTFTLRIDKKEGSGKYSVSLTGENISEWETDSSSHSFDTNSYLVVNVAEAGTLKECLKSLGCDLSTLKNLKVTGEITEEDFRVMREEMPQLTSVNLGSVKVVRIPYRVEAEGTDWWNQPIEYRDDMIPNEGLSNKGSLRRIVLPEGITRIGDNAFRDLRLTSTLMIPESVKRIDSWAFSCIGEEATIIMPSALEYIGGCSFYGLEAHMELKLANSIKYIGGSAFFRAHGVTGSFNIPSNIEYIGDRAFLECGHDLVGDIVIPVGFKEIQESAFNGMGFAKGTNLYLPEGLNKIGNSAFARLKYLSPVVIPESVSVIGAAAFKLSTFAGGSVKIPNNLKYLGRQAFAVTNLGGAVTYPTSLDVVLGGGGDNAGAFGETRIERLIIGDDVLQIEQCGFRDIETLEYVSIGKNVGYIGLEAFAYCYSLQTVVCLATEPPTLDENVFQDVPLDRAILEVPEEAIEKYRVAPGWKLFANITPHKELSFGISEIKCLNKGVSRTARLTAEGAWTVSDCPSWVKVSPSSGDYKDELTVTVNPLGAGEEGREGRIVFTLNGKNYSTYTTVRQNRCEEGEEDKEIILQQASKGAKEIPVFIVGEGFDADNITDGEYMQRMRETMEQLFEIEPYKSYRDYFTVTTAITCSPERGTGDVYTFRANCFGTDGVVPDEWKLREYTGKVSEHAGRDMGNALIIILANREGFDGWAKIGEDGCSIAAIGLTNDVYPYDQRGLVQHFAGGEAFAGLGNESVIHFDHIKGCSCPGCNDMGRYNDMKRRGYYENLSMSSKMTDAPWNIFIFNPKYSSMVDMWEGGYNHFRGVWRSEANSVMNTYIAYFNTISRYAIYKEIKRRAGDSASLEDFIANDIIEIP
ncbi:MAG: fimbrillin family protein [Muribaculaceae bacterium]|nr:fimbrillin family protein [Muribaculaceae bacterium]